ncbi:hypothetical protein NMY22_g1438 [Coprinellus aureogranulatus]|nr:hypothetical protein NMY22_g1438 [Coprinellus aureogranulatus]
MALNLAKLDMKPKSPFTSLLYTNHAPTEQERTLIREYLSDWEGQIAQLERSERTMSDSIPPQGRPLKELLEIVAAHRALLAPSRRVPDDILREIFLQCLPTNHNATISARDPPLLVRQVCSRWRAIALSTPRLWSTIHIPLPISSASQRSLAEGWIGLSGALPLSISFSSVEQEATLPHLSPWYDQLSSIGDRLRSLELTLQADTEEELASFNDSQRSAGFNPLSHVARAAIHLEIGNYSFMLDARGVFNSLALHESTRLQELEFTCNFHILTFPDCSTNPQFWANLKTLDLQTRNINRPCKVVGTLLPPQAQAQGPLDPVVNEKLRHVSLALLNLSQLSTVELLAYCDWPSLTSLHLASLGENDRLEERSYVLEKLATKYGRVLTSLRFSFRSLPPSHLREVLSLLPNLIQLHIDDGTTRGWYATAHGCSVDEANDDDDDDDDDEKGEEGGNDDVLESLTPKECSTAAQYSCHFLQYLQWEGHTPFSDGAVKNLLLARASLLHSSIRMKQLVIHFDRCMQEDIRCACAPLVEDGLKLRLSYRTPDDLKEGDISNEYRDLYIREDPLVFGWE